MRTTSISAFVASLAIVAGSEVGLPAECVALNKRVSDAKAEATAKNTAAGKAAPTDSDYPECSSGYISDTFACWRECATVACTKQGGFCSTSDVLDECIEREKKISLHYQIFEPEGPLEESGLKKVKLQLKMGKFQYTQAQPPNPTKVTTSFDQVLEWKDTRMKTAHCLDQLPFAMTLPNTFVFEKKAGTGFYGNYGPPARGESFTQNNFQDLYFLPQLSPKGNVDKAEPLTRTVAVDTEEDTVTMHATHKTTFTLSEDDVETPYYHFPFDVHNVTLALSSEPREVDLVDCKGEWVLSTAEAGDASNVEASISLTDLDSITVAQAQVILPSSGEWSYDPDETKGPQIKLFRDTETPSACNVYIRIKRVSLVYAMKAFLPDMVVTSAGMFVMFINPQIPPLFGGRCTVLIVAMLITMNRSLNRDNKLGKVSYLLKVDIVALLNLILLLLALIASIIIHYQFRNNNTRKGVLLDKALRFALPTLLFPGLMVFEYTFLANESPVGPVTFLVCWIAVCALGVVLYNVRLYRKTTMIMAGVVSKLTSLDLSKPEAADILREAFEIFDADNSGALDAKEGKKLLNYVNPKLSREDVFKAIKEADRFGTGVTEEDFHDMVARWAETPKPVFVQKNLNV